MHTLPGGAESGHERQCRVTGCISAVTDLATQFCTHCRPQHLSTGVDSAQNHTKSSLLRFPSVASDGCYSSGRRGVASLLLQICTSAMLTVSQWSEAPHKLPLLTSWTTAVEPRPARLAAGLVVSVAGLGPYLCPLSYRRRACLRRQPPCWGRDAAFFRVLTRLQLLLFGDLTWEGFPSFPLIRVIKQPLQ